MAGIRWRGQPANEDVDRENIIAIIRVADGRTVEHWRTPDASQRHIRKSEVFGLVGDSTAALDEGFLVMQRRCSAPGNPPGNPRTHARPRGQADRRGKPRTRVAHACSAEPAGPRGRLQVHATHDPRITTRAAREAFMARFEREVDPEGQLPESERLRRAEAAKKAYFANLALKSAKARSGRRRSGS